MQKRPKITQSDYAETLQWGTPGAAAESTVTFLGTLPFVFAF